MNDFQEYNSSYFGTLIWFLIYPYIVRTHFEPNNATSTNQGFVFFFLSAIKHFGSVVTLQTNYFIALIKSNDSIDSLVNLLKYTHTHIQSVSVSNYFIRFHLKFNCFFFFCVHKLFRNKKKKYEKLFYPK